MLLACGERPLIVATVSRLCKLGKPGFWTFRLARSDERGIRVVAVNRIDRCVVGAEFVRAEEGQVVCLRRVQLLELESNSIVGQTWPGGKVDRRFLNTQIAERSCIDVGGCDFGRQWALGMRSHRQAR